MKIRFVDRKELVNQLLDIMLQEGFLSSEQQELLIGLTCEK